MRRPLNHFEAVLQAFEHVLADARILGRLLVEADQPAATFRQKDGGVREGPIARRLEFGHGVVARGRSRIADHEDRLAGLRRFRIPAQMVRRRHRLAVLIEAQQAEIEVVPREVEVVGIAAEEAGLELRREHQAHIVEAVEGVELVLPAVIEVDHLAVVFRRLGAGRLLDRGGRRRRRRHQIATGLARARGVHLAGHVVDRLQHLQEHARAALLFGGPDIAVLQKVDVLGRQRLHAAGDAVVVGQHQAGAGHFRRRAARDAPGALAHMVEPGLVDGGSIGGLHLGRREIIEGPHPLVRRRRGRTEHQRAGRGGGEKRLQGHSKAPLRSSNCRISPRHLTP